jgi:hypothetical protein
MRSASGYAHSDARNALRRFSTHLIHLFAKWNAAPDARLGLNLPLLRDIVFGSLEHIVWTAMVQRREDDIDVPKMSRDLAGAYLRAFDLDRERPYRPRIVRKKPQRNVAAKPGSKAVNRSPKEGRNGRLTAGTRHANAPSRDRD